MSQSAIAIAGGEESPNTKVRRQRKDAGETKEKTQKCGCCGEMFVTLARHYRANAVIKDGVATISESPCAKWARENGIDAKSVSIAKNNDREKGVKLLASLVDLGFLNSAQVSAITKKYDETHKSPSAE
jgi:hypothetical protein